MASNRYDQLANHRDSYAARVMMGRMSPVADRPRARKKKSWMWKEVLMLPLHHFGKARQQELLKLAGPAPSNEQDNDAPVSVADARPKPVSKLAHRVVSQLHNLLYKAQQLLRARVDA